MFANFAAITARWDSTAGQVGGGGLGDWINA